MQVFRKAVACHRLNQHEDAAGRERFADMRAADGIAHVMQRIEDAGEVTTLARKVFRARDLEVDIGDACFGGVLRASSIDGSWKSKPVNFDFE
ncbi:MAG: hypothetical protein R3C58_14045 [Parvularculaceae bacterium]